MEAGASTHQLCVAASDLLESGAPIPNTQAVRDLILKVLYDGEAGEEAIRAGALAILSTSSDDARRSHSK